ncbi:unnamed protein product [Durusdinium trenchii]|uniref:Uncharacterized protein n=2 Tax=Durusdinium trenchii TaxID=1381693 RepID=A0ABP0RUV7_9DINO
MAMACHFAGMNHCHRSPDKGFLCSSCKWACWMCVHCLNHKSCPKCKRGNPREKPNALRHADADDESESDVDDGSRPGGIALGDGLSDVDDDFIIHKQNEYDKKQESESMLASSPGASTCSWTRHDKQAPDQQSESFSTFEPEWLAGEHEAEETENSSL